MRDDACTDCRQLTGGDCGKHGAITMPSLNLNTNYVPTPRYTMTREDFEMCARLVEEQKFESAWGLPGEPITEQIWNMAIKAAARAIRTHAAEHGAPWR